MTKQHISVLAVRILTIGSILSILLSACSTVTNLGRGPIANLTPAAPIGGEGTPLAPAPPIPQTSGGGASNASIRGVFFYDWFPESWSQGGFNPDSHYKPVAGYYDSADTKLIKDQIAAMQYGNISLGIVSWWGQDTPSDQRLPKLLEAAQGTDFHWAVYYETSARASLSADQAQADLAYIGSHYGNDPSYLRIDGRFVVFVFNPASAGCSAADLWKTANANTHAYLVLKVFSGYRDCTSQPDGWHQYAPGASDSPQGAYSYTISPGFWRMGESARLERDLSRWYDSIRKMIASKARFQLITSFNDWGDGTAIENSPTWDTSSGYGAFLDALHDNGVGKPPAIANLNAPEATPTAPAAQGEALPQATPTALPQAQAQAQPNGQSGAPLDNPQKDPIILAAGDISSCASPGDFSTAKIIEKFPNAPVLALGDTAYENGTLAQFQDCFNPSWGQFKDRIHPAVGNHEYLTPQANGYFTYFGESAGDPNQGWYSFDVGKWHIIALNSNCSKVGGCGADSPQGTWLKADLAAHPAQCTLAYWHHPRFSSGEHGDQTFTAPLWDILYQAGADVILSGHDHDYERFMPVDANGNPDPQNGMREFVVGTGGKNYYPFGSTIEPISQAHADNVFGVLELVLHPDSYDWKFLPEPGKSFTDSGSGTCH